MTAASSNRFVQETAAPNLFAQKALQDELFKLGSVLNGLEHGARRMRKKVYALAQAVQSGAYTINALELSRCIVRECMSSGA